MCNYASYLCYFDFSVVHTSRTLHVQTLFCFLEKRLLQLWTEVQAMLQTTGHRTSRSNNIKQRGQIATIGQEKRSTSNNETWKQEPSYTCATKKELDLEVTILRVIRLCRPYT